MTNDIDQDDKPKVLANEPVETDSPEEVVRRLLESENSNSQPNQPTQRKKTGPPLGNSQPNSVKSPVNRMTEASKRKVLGYFEQMRSLILSYRPTPRHMAVVLLSVIFLIMPWLIPVLALLGSVLLLVSYLTVGHERSGELIAAWYGRLMRTSPDRAEALRARAEHASTRLSGLLKYLPKRWTAGFNLPDFTRPDETPELLASDPFERLANNSPDK